MSSISGGGVTGSGIVVKKGHVFSGTSAASGLVSTRDRYTVPIGGLTNQWIDALELNGFFSCSLLQLRGSSIKGRFVDTQTGDVLMTFDNAVAANTICAFGYGFYNATGTGYIETDSVTSILLSNCKLQINVSAGTNAGFDVQIVEL